MAFISYAQIRKILFRLDPEWAHKLALTTLSLSTSLGLAALFPKPPSFPRSVMGLTFPNPVGLAAGFDKNGDYIDALATLGFGFIELGTVTPKPQKGNPPPRLFRLAEDQALINRLGFNNKGVDYLVKRLQKKHFSGILGINLGKNRDTALENAIDDYLYGFRRVAPYASYITINLSSPNTPGLRNLQYGETLRQLLHALKKEQAQYSRLHHKYIPLALKIAPDLTQEELKFIGESLLSEQMDAVIATNTTISREGIKNRPEAAECGGLSGKPLNPLSTKLIKDLHTILQDQIPIIASGGIVSEHEALEKMAAGAVLIQVYTGLIYQGPGWLIKLIESCH